MYFPTLIPIAGYIVDLGVSAAEFFAGYHELKASNIAINHDLLDLAEFLKDIGVIDFSGIPGMNILLASTDLAVIMANEKDDVIGAIINKEFKAEMKSSSKDLFGRKYEYVYDKVKGLIDNDNLNIR